MLTENIIGNAMVMVVSATEYADCSSGDGLAIGGGRWSYQ